jgi:hypothetical protein
MIMIGLIVTAYLFFGFFFWMYFYASEGYIGGEAFAAGLTWPVVAVVVIARLVKGFWRGFW